MPKINNSHSGKSKFIKGRGKKRDTSLDVFETLPINRYDSKVNVLVNKLSVNEDIENKKREKADKLKAKRKAAKEARKANKQAVRENHKAKRLAVKEKRKMKKLQSNG